MMQTSFLLWLGGLISVVLLVPLKAIGLFDLPLETVISLVKCSATVSIAGLGFFLIFAFAYFCYENPR
jgi:hypothetical protein